MAIWGQAQRMEVERFGNKVRFKMILEEGQKFAYLDMEAKEAQEAVITPALQTIWNIAKEALAPFGDLFSSLTKEKSDAPTEASE